VLVKIPLSKFGFSLRGGPLLKWIANHYDVVSAIVTYDEPTESISQYARYQLKVNGVLQPGG
jgi:hypothetical protein